MDKSFYTIDEQIIKLLSERTEKYIEELKNRGSGNYEFLFEDQDEIFKFIGKVNKGPLSNDLLKKIYLELLSASGTAVKPLKVAFLGPEGTFTNIALSEIFGESVERIPTKTISDVFREVEAGNVTFGVVPVENSTEGSVTFTLDELIETDLNIVKEKFIRVSYTLLSKSNDIDSIKTLYSHPQPHGQCKEWIRNRLPNAEIVHVDSTSRAAEMAADNPASSAIASYAAAEIYKLNILAENIEDLRQNFTRFFVIGKTCNRPTENDKTSIVCAVKDKPAALLGLLEPLSNAGINMSKIESRPNKKKMWEYNFFIDFFGHKNDRVVIEALQKMKNETVFLKILGSYSVGN